MPDKPYDPDVDRRSTDKPLRSAVAKKVEEQAGQNFYDIPIEQMEAMSEQVSKILDFGYACFAALKQAHIEGTELDIDHFSSYAAQAGLMRQVSYDPDIHPDLDGGELAPGETIWWWGD